MGTGITGTRAEATESNLAFLKCTIFVMNDS
jgi:hypothetical protein